MLRFLILIMVTGLSVPGFAQDTRRSLSSKEAKAESSGSQRGPQKDKKTMPESREKSGSIEAAVGVGLPIIIPPAPGFFTHLKMPRYNIGIDAYFGQLMFSDPEFKISGPAYGLGFRYYPNSGPFYMLLGVRQRQIAVDDPQEFASVNADGASSDVINWNGEFRQTHLTAMAGWSLPIAKSFNFEIGVGVDALMSSSLKLDHNIPNPDLVTQEELTAEKSKEEDTLNRYFAMPVMVQILIGVSWNFLP